MNQNGTSHSDSLTISGDHVCQPFKLLALNRPECGRTPENREEGDEE